MSVRTFVLAIAAALASPPVVAADPDRAAAAVPEAEVKVAAVIDAGTPNAADEAVARRATELLAALGSGSAEQRRAAVTEIIGLAPRAIGQLRDFLARAHTSTIDDRRAALQLIHAAVPDDKGNFADPGRMKAEQIREDESFDWLAELLAVDPATPGVGEVIADVAVLRALAQTRDISAATVIIEAGFADDTMIYRDECGRRLRAMAPYSLPALVIASQSKLPARRRYATYQLERMDRQDPAKALTAGAGDEDLRIAILDAFREVKHREAVHTVLASVNDESPRVRTAARRAWLAYVTGKAPPPAPKKKLQLPGGKLAEKETALWLTYRELADADLRKLGEELFGEEYPEKQVVDLEALSRRVFSHYDQQRAQRDHAIFLEAKAKADAGDLEAAGVVFDQLLAQDPDRPEKTEMAAVYFARAQALEKAQTWDAAAAAYSKAHGVDPKGTHANDALAAHHYALGKAQEAAGKDGSAAFRRAVELKPNFEEAQVAAAGGPDRSRWLLYAAGAAALAGLIVFGVGIARRRAA